MAVIRWNWANLTRMSRSASDYSGSIARHGPPRRWRPVLLGLLRAPEKGQRLVLADLLADPGGLLLVLAAAARRRVNHPPIRAGAQRSAARGDAHRVPARHGLWHWRHRLQYLHPLYRVLTHLCR